jgi:dihydrolipoamide dehydrogenase
MSTRITILGAGSGGYIAAIRAARLGAQVTLIERDNIGGACLNWGCIPTKTLKTTAKLLENFHRARELGVEVDGEVRPNMARLMARKQEVIDNLATGILKILDSYKIQFMRGEGHMLEPTKVRVKGMDNSVVDVVSDKLILATGSRPLGIPALPFDGERILSSNDAISLQEISESILILGGGIIGCEFAFILNSLGSMVTVVEAMPRLMPMPSIDKDCSAIIQREMRKRKIQVLLNRTIEKVELTKGRVRVTIGPSPSAQRLKESEKRPLLIEMDKMVVCIGRQPNTQGIGLDQLGLEMDTRGWILANERMETNVPHVYAVGDVLGPSKMMLAYTASAEGMVAAQNAMGGSGRMNYELVPTAVFTFPEVADVGKTEDQARASGFDVRADTFLFRTLGRAQATGEIAGQVKIVSDTQTKRILGVHIVGSHAADLISEGTMAIKMGATVNDLAETIHAHPTFSEAIMEASHKALDAGLHYLRDD